MTPISTRYPPPVELDESDPYVAYLLRQAPQDIRDAAFRYALGVLCDGRSNLITTFNALDILLRSYEASGENAFSVRQIERVAPGVGRGNIHTYIRELAERRIIQIVGRKEGKQLQRAGKDGELQDLRSVQVYIDHEYLNRLAVKMYAELLQTLGLPLPRPKVRPSPGQYTLDLSDTSPKVSHARLSDSLTSGAVSIRHKTDQVSLQEDSQSIGHTPGASRVSLQEDSRGQSVLAETDQVSLQEDSRGQSVLAETDQVSLQEDSQSIGHTPGASRVSLQEDSRGQSVLAETDQVSLHNVMIDHVIDHEVSDRVSEEGSRALRGHTHLNVTLRDIVREELRTALGGIAQASLNASPQPTEYPEKVPAPPAGESEVGAGPLQTWVEATGSYPAPGVALQLRELECQFNKKAGGYGAYWLVRVIRSASLSIREPSEMKPPYLLPIFRRLEAGNFDSSVLIDRSEPRQRPQEAEPEQRSAPDRRTGDPGSDLASELRAVPAVRVQPRYV